MNDVPNMNIQGPRGSEGGGSNLANSPELIYVYGFLVASYKGFPLTIYNGLSGPPAQNPEKI